MRNHITMGLLIAAGVAQANIVIDDFTSGTYHQTITSGTTTANQTGTMIGGDRFVTSQVNANTFGLELGIDIEGGAFTVSSQSGVGGTSQLRYGYFQEDGQVLMQDMNANLGAQNQFALNFISSDLGGSYKIDVRSSSSNGGNVVSYTNTFQGNSVNTPFTKTVDFSNFAGINFADLDQIGITFYPGNSGDVSLSSIQAVPEPASLIALASAAALAARRKKLS